MPTIVFACKSNSCRSQMAEGWARNWLQRKKDDVDLKLQMLMKADDGVHSYDTECKSIDADDNGTCNNNYEIDHDHCNENNNRISSSESKIESLSVSGSWNNQKRNQMKKQKLLLENTIIASVALDASAVFENEGGISKLSTEDGHGGSIDISGFVHHGDDHYSTCTIRSNTNNDANVSTTTTTGAQITEADKSNQSINNSKNNNNNINHSNNKNNNNTMLEGDGKSKNMVSKVKRRKHVKAKAVNAMAEDGVDIGLYVPKTLDEILPLVNSKKKSFNPHENENHNHNTAYTDDIIDQNNNDINNIDNIDTVDVDDVDVTVDKLIVLCSCGDELKHKLTRRSKSVEEWNIDAPTAAAKNGEGDAAYRRVSLELKNEVTILMESLIGDVV